MGRRPVRIKKKERWSTHVFRLFGWHSRVDIVGQQTLDHEAGIFSAVKQNDLPGTLKLIDQDPQCLTLRDSVGAAPVLVAFLYGHVELGKQIVLKNRDLASLTYNTLDYTGRLSPYEGENILHIAIVQRRRGLARWLLQHVPELINAETIGKFFRPSKTCYFGGSPLLFALSSN
ncbi:hypothetical protein Poli38472_012433 [Pythium oligandrum]|uniref:Uncharacterized protein n=1 Tax=Pythium oligandrum TaxID=41045 RepID=A0A8K1CRE4_PYTOL|nr:hypothetical protein Poli38472_012433 [Pythium oligandrum]|eukprot:TMW67317.1 hypothetical protein Poli38472_012433 [Pythium oligandrum]